MIIRANRALVFRQPAQGRKEKEEKKEKKGVEEILYRPILPHLNAVNVWIE